MTDLYLENYIRFPGKILTVKPEPVAHIVKERADNNFRFCITGLNPAHVPASMSFGNPVHNLNAYGR